MCFECLKSLSKVKNEHFSCFEILPVGRSCLSRDLRAVILKGNGEMIFVNDDLGAFSNSLSPQALLPPYHPLPHTVENVAFDSS